MRVSFTDLDGHPEARTSDAWPATTVAANAAPTAAAKTVTLDEDTTHTFSAADFGFQDADPGDALASLRIAARPAAGTFALGGTPVTDNQEIAAAQLGQLVFAPPPDANGAGYASFTFRVSDGTDESALAYTITLDVDAVNDPATGAPTISGTERVGHVLTADVSAIEDDADGLPQASSFLYQWLRVSGANETPIQGASASTYRLEAADAGAKFKVRVSFTDLDGHPEARTSDAWPTQQTVLVNTAPTGASKTIGLAEDGFHPFSEADFGYRDGDGDALASVTIATLPAQGKGALALGGNGAGTPVTANQEIAAAQLGQLVFAPPPDANGAGYASFTFRVSDGTDESALAYTITLDVDAVNDPATGAPTISGTERVGHVLTADVSAIEDDADGLPDTSTFAYQWLRVSGANETPIQGASASTYRLEAADAGAKFKVRVSFTDLDGHPEARTSDAWPATTVAANAAPTAAAKTVTLDEDTTHTFSAADFGFQDADPGDALASLRIAARPAAGTARPRRHSRDRQPGDRRRAAGPARVRPAARRQRRRLRQLHVQGQRRHRRERLGLHHHPRRRRGERPRDRASDDLGHGACGACADGGRERDRGRCRRPAAPASFLYQWLRVAGGNETPIQGASASTYRLEAADAGAKFKVRVSFTDLDGHPEARTSDAWPTQQTVLVNTAPTGASKTIGLAEDGFHPFSEADFGYRDGDGDALASVTIATLPAQGKGTLALGGTPVTDNQEIAAAQLGQLVFAPPPDANGAGYASFTFRVSDGTDESALAYTITLDVTAVNDPATGLPTISGTARVGQTLTADVSAIRDDADGLPQASSFLYQWLRVSGANETPILNADARTYRLASADAGAKFKVRVSFTDLDGHPEARTSNAWPATTLVENAVPTSNFADGDLRLVDGQEAIEGRLEIFHRGEWGTICDDYWNRTEADLSCRLLGYDAAVEDWERYRTAYFGPGTGPIVLDDLHCTGNEAGLLQCPRNGLAVREHNCRHTEDVSLRCTMAPKLVDIEHSSSPGPDGRYDIGETIELALVWSEPVVIEAGMADMVPKVWLYYEGDSGPSGTPRTKLSPFYVRGSGTARTVFAVTLYSSQGPPIGSWTALHTLRVEGDTLNLRHGSIRALDDGAHANLGHDEYRWELAKAGQQVAVDPPTVDGTPRLSGAGNDGVWSPGENIGVTVTFSAPVEVDTSDGTPSIGINLSGLPAESRSADYTSGSGTTELVFRYELVQGDVTHRSVTVKPSSLELNGGTIRSVESPVDADLAHNGYSGPGPQTLPVVSIAPASSPVSEGTAASFVLTRTGSTAAALAVEVSVSETGAALSGTPSTSVTFAAGSASAVLGVATEDDEVAEAASTVTAALSADAGYTVDGASGTAEVVVDDDDAAPVVETASPIEVAENATAVATLAANDEDTAAADLSWSIPEGEAGGTDAAQFALTADGVLSFKAAKDFEAPDDAEADGDYEVTVRVTDGANPVDAALVVRLQDADDAAPVLTGASVVGAALTLTFGEALDGDSTPPASSFAATVAGGARTVDAVSISESTVALTLSSAVTSGQTVTVGYTVPTGEDAAPLQDAAGNRVAAFADAQATNETAAALPEVSIAAASSPVTEGTAASFTLTRTGSTAAALTVAVSVSQAGSVLTGTAPTSATFAAEASTTRLAAATANDAVHEADARVTATLAGARATRWTAGTPRPVWTCSTTTRRPKA